MQRDINIGSTRREATLKTKIPKRYEVHLILTGEESKRQT